MRVFKKILVLGLSCSLVLSSNSIVLNAQQVTNTPVSVNITSAEYPNADIDSTFVSLTDSKIVIKDDNLSIVTHDNSEKNIFETIVNSDEAVYQSVKENIENGAELVGIVTSEVTVEETFTEVDGEYICTESKLLSEDEKNLAADKNNMLKLQALPVGSSYTDDNNLVINFAVYKVNSSHAAEYQLIAITQWKTTSGAPKTSPAGGYDYCGLAWGGSFDYSSASMYGTLNNSAQYKPFTASSIDPNKGHVWKFYEELGDGVIVYNYENMTSKINLFKNKLTGRGNTTAFTCQYIHTYQSAQGSISISPPSFSLSNCSKQWSLSAAVTNIPY